MKTYLNTRTGKTIKATPEFAATREDWVLADGSEPCCGQDIDVDALYQDYDESLGYADNVQWDDVDNDQEDED